MAVHLIYDETNPRAYPGMIFALVMLGISWTVVTTRFIARFLIRSIGMDDWTIIPAQVCYTGFIVSSLYFFQTIPGAHALSLEAAKEGTLWIIAQQATFPTCTLFWKLSLGFFFLRIVVLKKLKLMVYFLMAVSTVVNITVFFFCLFMCGNPRDFFANQVAGKCIPQKIQVPFVYTYCSINALVDLAFTTLPFFLLHRSKLPSRTKRYVLGVLLFATISVGASFARIWYVGNLLKGKESFVGFSAVNIVTIIELGIGIIASSIVTLRPLQNFGESIRRFRSSIYPGYNKGNSELDSEKPDTKSDFTELGNGELGNSTQIYSQYSPEPPETTSHTTYIQNYSKPYAFK